MSKNTRKRAMVYSNVNKKADKKSASNNNEIINLDNEIVIGLARLPEPKEVNSKNKKKNNNSKQLEQPHYNKKRKNKKKRIKLKKITTLTLFTILLIGGFTFFLLSPVFNTKTIEVRNNKNISTEQIINMSGIPINENMFKFSKKNVKQSITSNPYVEEAKISRKLFSNKVEIEIKERTATLMLEYGNSYVYINNQGYILEISSNKLNTPIIKGYVTPLEEVKPGNRLNKNDLERLKVVLNIIELANSNGLEGLITQINIEDDKNYKIIIESEDKTIYLGECTDLSTQMLYIKEMLKREKGIEGEFFINMDLNKNKPVFREKV